MNTTPYNLKESLNGMFWDVGATSFAIPRLKNASRAVFVYRQNRVPIIRNLLYTFEENPVTLSQTETILGGHTVSGLTIRELMQVVRYGKADRELIRMLQAGEFALDTACASRLHGIVGQEEAFSCGSFRTEDFRIRGVAFIPPQAADLQEIATKGFTYLKTQVKDPQERAIAIFLFMARNQFFFDANKRTASLMMNGALMQEGFFPITVPSQVAKLFHEKLSRFYETGDANDMMAFFQKETGAMYPPKAKLPEFV